MNLDRFRALVATYGAEPKRWPGDERAQAEALLAASAEARQLAAEARTLDAFLDRWLPPPLTFDAQDLAQSVTATLRTRPTPRQRRSDWRLSIGWPKVAALAAAALAGIVVGWSGLDHALATRPDGSMAEILDRIAVGEEALW